MPGPNLFATVHIACMVWLGAKMAAARRHFKFSLRSNSSDRYIDRNDSSNPILPTINDIHFKIGNMSDYYSCTVYALQFQDTLQRGWLKHSNTVQNPLTCRHSGQSRTKYTCKHHPSSRGTKLCMCQALLQHFPHTFPCSWNVAAWSGVQPVPSFWALMSAVHRAVRTLEATTESTPSSVPQHTCTLLQKACHNIVKTPKRCCGCWIVYTMCKLTG